MTNPGVLTWLSRPRTGAALLLATASMVATGCYSNPDPTEWNAQAHRNFVDACTTATAAKNGTTTTSLIASKASCECIYELIKAPEPGEKGRYAVTWDELKGYESKQASAAAGSAPPMPPTNLTKAIEECAPNGPGL